MQMLGEQRGRHPKHADGKEEKMKTIVPTNKRSEENGGHGSFETRRINSLHQPLVVSVDYIEAASGDPVKSHCPAQSHSLPGQETHRCCSWPLDADGPCSVEGGERKCMYAPFGQNAGIWPCCHAAAGS